MSLELIERIKKNLKICEAKYEQNRQSEVKLDLFEKDLFEYNHQLEITLERVYGGWQGDTATRYQEQAREQLTLEYRKVSYQIEFVREKLKKDRQQLLDEESILSSELKQELEREEN